MKSVLVREPIYPPSPTLRSRLISVSVLRNYAIASITVISSVGFCQVIDSDPPPPAPTRPEARKEASIPPTPVRPTPMLTTGPGRMGAEPASRKSLRAAKGRPPAADTQPIPVPPAPTEPEVRRVRVADGSGRVVVARVYGGPDSKVVLLPDGQLGWPETLVFTDAPFQADPPESIARALLDGPYRGFEVVRDEHYLVFSQASTEFTRASLHLLESLYRGLTQELLKAKIAVHATEFPLVAVIFRNEAEFRAHKKVEPEVQAYYEILTNRIFFYERSARDLDAPEIASRRRPQTVAHEGTHQILQNVGVQPRLAEWPLWLVEGLAEFCAPPMVLKKADWAGIRRVNPLHMATLHDLRDSMALQAGGDRVAVARVGRVVGEPNMVESLVSSGHLSPTDYALAWALTHYLAVKKPEEFVAYLKEMGRLAPLAKVTPEDQLRTFRHHFGADLGRLGKAVDRHIDGLKGYENLPCYAVVFEQTLPNGSIRRGTLVSQSSSLIRQWIEGMHAPNGGPVLWHPYPFPTRTRALIAAEQWLQGH